MPQHIVVVGAGVMGACTAYYLSKRATGDVRVTVVEKTAVACGASGKAGGFLALDWNDGSEIGELTRASFNLHAELAKSLNGERYGYRRVETYSVYLSFGSGKSNKEIPRENSTIDWLDTKRVRSVDTLGTVDNTAQVHPELFTHALLEDAVATGHVQVRCGQGVASLLYGDDDPTKVIGVELDNGEKIDADAVVICMGPWSGTLPMKGRRRNMLPITGSRAHSIVMKPEKTVPAQALFTAIADGSRIYPRPDGTVYMCGPTDTEELPQSADQVKVDSTATDTLRSLASKISPILASDGTQVVATQACYLPISRDGVPLIGAHPNHQQLYIGTGHSCWGILNSPITGLMLSELLLDGRISCLDSESVEAVDPKNRCS
ncbi:FAD dependent oxidoreductase [Radiomyces spectabilis]|uniref:FAD dependent oxidoreductase n=1 Tax=Radiomyces spectabilis TaxID=64574 RepID=UPI00221F7191|nr:FAD dependent oxidoreductase [Radiomyces spectabilis]KAI8376099.1 FAD dependent oxidoreductase [Radiomyces spectabilis]